MADLPHQCWTVDSTAYLRNLDREDLQGECIAVHYQAPPVKSETGTSISLRYPILIMSEYLTDKRDVAEKLMRILNEHWEDGE